MVAQQYAGGQPLVVPLTVNYTAGTNVSVIVIVTNENTTQK